MSVDEKHTSEQKSTTLLAELFGEVLCKQVQYWKIKSIAVLAYTKKRTNP